ncbi:hypothetical protein [Pseudoclavibacter helvolus]|uniref:hypothetical protein n=1 Tax=Pseudoclavibacter helvolus TaxID=255205 RepID=UPI0024AE7F17|nr:hypothetical protein [Pseudoclavibacter helvolus]
MISSAKLQGAAEHGDRDEFLAWVAAEILTVSLDTRARAKRAEKLGRANMSAERVRVKIAGNRRAGQLSSAQEFGEPQFPVELLERAGSKLIGGEIRERIPRVRDPRDPRTEILLRTPQH